MRASARILILAVSIVTGCIYRAGSFTSIRNLRILSQKRALFVELPPFERQRNACLDDESFRAMQNALMDDPSAGAVIQGTGGLRKLRWTDKRRGKGKRGGLRVIYFYWVRGLEFWLFTIYDKNELNDLSKKDRARLEALLKAKLKMRNQV